jgi:hypothetical protein
LDLQFACVIKININSFYSAEKIFNVDLILETHASQELVPDIQQISEYEHPLTPDEHSTPTTQESTTTVSKKLLSSLASLIDIKNTYD